MSLKVLFVCLGNICRSPLAEAIFKHKVRQMGEENNFLADSCGTADYHIGQPPDHRTLRNAVRNGVAITHACRQLAPEDFQDFDYLVAMDRHNFNHLVNLSPQEHRNKIIKMRAFDPQHKDSDVPDPYYGNERDFQEVFDILDRTMSHFIDHLKQKPQV